MSFDEQSKEKKDDTKEFNLIKWIWERRLTSFLNVGDAINLIELNNRNITSDIDHKRIEEIWNKLQEDFNVKNVSKEFICLKCKRVFRVGAMFARCCEKEIGKNLEEFSPEKHGRDLISLSNSWISVWEKWKDHSKLREIFVEMSEHGNYGASSGINLFIEKLLNDNDKDK